MEWISVDDRLPELGQCVDVWIEIIAGYSCGDVGRVENCFRNKDGKWWKWNDKCNKKITLNDINVSHWMPLPSPPEAK